jgi:hypothetical protein
MLQANQTTKNLPVNNATTFSSSSQLYYESPRQPPQAKQITKNLPVNNAIIDETHYDDDLDEHNQLE